MDSNVITVYIIGGVAIGMLLIVFGVLLYGFNRYSKTGDHLMASMQLNKLVGIGVLIAVAALAVTAAVNVWIPDAEKATEAEVKKYDDSLKSGYTLYYEGQKSTGDAININKDTINDYDISYDKDKHIVRVTKHTRSDTRFIPLPIYYH